jgi:hypothetical protein
MARKDGDHATHASGIRNAGKGAGSDAHRMRSSRNQTELPTDKARADPQSMDRETTAQKRARLDRRRTEG